MSPEVAVNIFGIARGITATELLESCPNTALDTFALTVNLYFIPLAKPGKTRNVSVPDESILPKILLPLSWIAVTVYFTIP